MDIICLNTRKSLVDDPKSVDVTIQKHISSCDSCRDYYNSMKAFYATLASSLKLEIPSNLASDIISNVKLEEKLTTAMQVEVPKDLESRILMTQRKVATDVSNVSDNVHEIKSQTNISAGTTVRKQDNNFKWMSIAAGIVLAIGLSIGTYKLGESHGFEQQVFAHMNEDAYALERNDNVQLTAFNKMFKRHGIQANENIGTIRYAGNCPIDGKVVPHFVLDFNGKTLTVAYIPGETINKNRVSNERFEGKVFGAGKGSFMILAEENKTPLEEMQKHVMSSIELVDI